MLLTFFASPSFQLQDGPYLLGRLSSLEDWESSPKDMGYPIEIFGVLNVYTLFILRNIEGCYSTPQHPHQFRCPWKRPYGNFEVLFHESFFLYYFPILKWKRWPKTTKNITFTLTYGSKLGCLKVNISKRAVETYIPNFTVIFNHLKSLKNGCNV